MARSIPTGGREEPDRVRVFVNVTGVRSDHSREPLLRELLEEGVRATLERASIGVAEISLTLVDDARIRELNRRYLDRDRPTDVIAFPLYEADEPVVGDVYVGSDQARRQAAERGIPLDEELIRLAIHGTLHVLGYDHPEGDEREGSEMFRHQETLVETVLACGGRSDAEQEASESRGEAR